MSDDFENSKDAIQVWKTKKGEWFTHCVDCHTIVQLPLCFTAWWIETAQCPECKKIKPIIEERHKDRCSPIFVNGNRIKGRKND